MKEISVPTGFLLNTKAYNVEIKPNQTTKLAIVNKEPTGTFTLTKENEAGNVKIKGVKYKVWSEDNTYNQVHETSSAGQIKIEGLKLRKIFLSRATKCGGLLDR